MYTIPLSTLITSCSLNHHLYADVCASEVTTLRRYTNLFIIYYYDTQLFLSFLPTHFDSSIDHLHNALDRISPWMTATLNSSKTVFQSHNSGSRNRSAVRFSSCVLQTGAKCITVWLRAAAWRCRVQYSGGGVCEARTARGAERVARTTARTRADEEQRAGAAQARAGTTTRRRAAPTGHARARTTHARPTVPGPYTAA